MLSSCECVDVEIILFKTPGWCGRWESGGQPLGLGMHNLFLVTEAFKTLPLIMTHGMCELGR